MTKVIIELELIVALINKGGSMGSHNLTGARINKEQGCIEYYRIFDPCQDPIIITKVPYEELVIE